MKKEIYEAPQLISFEVSLGGVVLSSGETMKKESGIWDTTED